MTTEIMQMSALLLAGGILIVGCAGKKVARVLRRIGQGESGFARHAGANTEADARKMLSGDQADLIADVPVADNVWPSQRNAGSRGPSSDFTA